MREETNDIFSALILFDKSLRIMPALNFSALSSDCQLENSDISFSCFVSLELLLTESEELG